MTGQVKWCFDLWRIWPPVWPNWTGNETSFRDQLGRKTCFKIANQRVWKALKVRSWHLMYSRTSIWRDLSALDEKFGTVCAINAFNESGLWYAQPLMLLVKMLLVLMGLLKMWVIVKSYGINPVFLIYDVRNTIFDRLPLKVASEMHDFSIYFLAQLGLKAWGLEALGLRVWGLRASGLTAWGFEHTTHFLVIFDTEDIVPIMLWDCTTLLLCVATIKYIHFSGDKNIFISFLHSL